MCSYAMLCPLVVARGRAPQVAAPRVAFMHGALPCRGGVPLHETLSCESCRRNAACELARLSGVAGTASHCSMADPGA